MTRVALVFGGKSPEHEVSIVSARNVYALLQEAGFEAIPIGIDRVGVWHVGPQSFAILAGEEACDKTSANPLAQLAELRADVLFPLVHGFNGEDGLLAAVCSAAGLPYVGGDQLNMSLCWDKLTTRMVLAASEIPQLPYLGFYRAEFQMEAALDQIEARFAYPIFVKPSRTGSSIGISRALDRRGLAAALELAFEFDYRVIVEPGLVDALEVEISGLGGAMPQLSIPARIIPENAFYDFEEKYINNATRFEIPAVLTPWQLARMREIASKAWQVLNCYGMARIDFLITADEVYLNEVNTYPGFTNISMYPRLLREMGVDGVSLMRTLVQLAFDRDRLLPVRSDFSSNVNWWKQ